MKTRIAFSFIVAAAVGIGWSAVAKQEAKRLVLAQQQRLELAPATMNRDSLSVDFTVAVAGAQKYKRHRCVISANRTYVLKTAPLQRWALRGDTLMVLSEVDLSLRVPAKEAHTFEMKFEFVNLDAAGGRGVATLIVTGPQSKPAAAGAKTEPQDRLTPPSSAVESETSAKAASATATKDSDAAKMLAASDSATAAGQSQPGLETIAKKAEEQGRGLLWVLFALLLLGVALIALLHVAGKFKARTFNKETRTRSNPMAVPPADRSKAISMAEKATLLERQRPGSREASVEKLEPKSAATFHPSAHEEIVSAKPEANADRAVSPAEAEIDLFAENLTAPESAAAPAALQTALDRLRDLASETQKALAVQSQALERFSQHTENMRGLLLEKPTGAKISSPNDSATATRSGQNGHGLSASGPQAAEPPLRVLAAEQKSENVEELASAIDSLIAASATKPLAAPAAVITQKIDSLRRIAGGLQELIKVCRTQSLSEPLAQVDGLARKVLDLQLSYETWLADQSVKLSFSLPRLAQTEAPDAGRAAQTRREIVEALINNLDETRKIAVQGPIYFARRVTQLHEYDLPKLRYQLKEVENDEMRTIWEGMM